MDSIICATGYKITFPYLSQDILPVNRNKVRLYKHQFLPNLKHPQTLAIIGLVQVIFLFLHLSVVNDVFCSTKKPIGAIFPVAEIQARWFAQLMAGKSRLPSKEAMEMSIREQERYLSRFYDSERQTIQVHICTSVMLSCHLLTVQITHQHRSTGCRLWMNLPKRWAFIPI